MKFALIRISTTITNKTNDKQSAKKTQKQNKTKTHTSQQQRLYCKQNAILDIDSI